MVKIIEILPALKIGGAERHVIDLSNELVKRGHQVMVISWGGRMESQFDSRVETYHLPVHCHELLMRYLCSRKIASIIKKGGWEIIHAHSRVPAWIAMNAAKIVGIPLIVTCHVDFKNKRYRKWKPYREAKTTICVSKAVQEGMKSCFYENTVVIPNGLDTPKIFWNEENLKGTAKFLFIGRLADQKGMQDIFPILPKEGDWTLDIVGEGSKRTVWEKIATDRGIASKVTFHGFSDTPDEFMAKASCLLFPSYREGYGLVLARAIQIGLPFIASDISTISELIGTRDNLLLPGDRVAWKNAIDEFIATRKTRLSISPSVIRTLEQQVDDTVRVYEYAIYTK